MNDTVATNQADAVKRTVTDIPSMLLPVEGRVLLLPGVSIAEIIPSPQVTRPDDAPEWFLGTVTWRKLEVPVVSFTMLNEQFSAHSSRNRHLAVLNNTGVSDNLPFLAITIQGIPRLTRITAIDLGDDTETVLSPMELLAVRLGDEPVIIPNVSALEKACLTYYSP